MTTATMEKDGVTDPTCIVADRCLQLFGGYGVLRSLAGANEVMNEFVARSP